MQNKGAIRLLAILLALVSIYQLSFTYIVNSEKDKAAEYVKNNPTVTEAEYLDSLAGEEVYNFLWLRNFTFRECQERELNLGLDLKGGMNVVLEVSVVDILQSLANNQQDSVFVATMNKAMEAQKDSQDEFVTLFGNAFNEVAPSGFQLASLFISPELKEIDYNSSNEEVLEVIRAQANGAIDNSFNILRSRIDHFGVSQPNIQTLDRPGRILVELPGIKDPDRVRKLLQGTANLEFWETYDNTEAYEYISAANDKLRDILSAKIEKDSTKIEVEEPIQKDTTIEELALLSQDSLLNDTSESLIDKLEKDTTQAGAIDENLTQFTKNNPLFAVLYPNVDRNRQLVRGSAAVGYSQLKDTAKVNRYLNMPQVQELLPRNLKLLWEVKPFDENNELVYLVAIKVTNRDGLPALGGDVITNAREEFGNNQATAEVTMTMNAEGASAWARLTKENIGKQIAVVLDNFVYSFPTVNSEITGGSSQITGGFSIKEAKDLANILKSGKLPAPAKIIEEEIVGPSLGQEAISNGLWSFVLAFVVILLYMVFYYKSAGIVADIALIANIFFIFGVLASLGAVLTLPGLAGIVLTIGMSVDANVLIYERIREELNLGKGLKLAITDGYKHALSAILDANITTLLTGIVLFIFGHGPIKGFATTLIIGIITSLFAAIFITRLTFLAMLDRKKKVEFATKLTANAFKNTNIKFIGKRKIFYGVSGVLVAIGLFSLFTKGLNQGIDFVGGRTYVVKFENPVNTVDIAKTLAVEFDGNVPEVKTYGGDDQVKISTKYLVDSDDANTDSIVENKLYNGLKSIIGEEVSFGEFIKDYRQSSRKVGPTIADDIKVAAVYSIVFSLLIMFIYMFIRFKNWQFGLGAFAALVHDVLIVLGLFSILGGLLPFSLELDQAFIAAILTVIGYSLNDTVVVFDRIREYVREHKRGDRRELYNSALNSTLSRTFSTSLSTFFVLLSIFVFGGEVIRGFVFALLIGVVVGTYSSLFIATPVVFDTIKRQDEVKEDATKQYLGGKKKEKKKQEA